MIFSVMSREKARKFSFSKIDKKTVIISITDVDSEYNKFNRQPNIIDVCPVKFDDVEKGEENCITKQDAEKIVNFIKRYKDIAEHVIVHCEAGVSRSAGVCAALLYATTGSDMQIFDDAKYCPNMTCYRTILNACDELQYGLFENENTISENEINEKEKHNISIWKKANDLDEEKTYVHYGGKVFDKNKFKKIKNIIGNKPSGGFWACPTDSEKNWKNWCTKKHGTTSELDENNAIFFKLKDDAKIFKIHSLDDCNKLKEMYKTENDIFAELRFFKTINYEKMLEDGWDGVELLISSDSRLYDEMYGWDVDSILVLNPDIVLQIDRNKELLSNQDVKYNEER